MTIAERNNKLKHFITCLKCEVSGKVCDDNCSTQYDAGNMGEIIENLEAISKALEQEPMEKFKSVKAHIFKLAGDYKCWDNRLTDDEALELCHILEQEPQIRPKGHWIYDYTTTDGHRTYHCSKCGCYLQPKHSEPLDSFKWCSLCGAEMREVEE